ncbi:MAG: exo-alpha-sialidase [Spirosomataceae bacterium]
MLFRCCCLGVLLCGIRLTYGQSLQKENIFSPQAQHVHGSSVVELPNGDLLTVWFQGSGERQADDVAIMGARLKKGKTQWSAPFVMADVPDFPDINPVVFLDQQKQLWLVWYTVLAYQWETSLLKYRVSTNYLKDGPPEWKWQEVLPVRLGQNTNRGIQTSDSFVSSVRQKMQTQEAFFKQSPSFRQSPKPDSLLQRWEAEQHERLDLAQGKTFMRSGIEIQPDGKEVKKSMGYPLFSRIGWQTRNKPLFMGNRMLLPLYSDGFDFSLIAITDDGGQHWQFSEPLVGLANIQPSLVLTKDQKIVAYMRDNGPPPYRLMLSTSADKGLTWSDVVDSDIPNPGAGADLVALQNGHWVLADNDTESGRHRLAILLSEDEGKTWPYKQYLEWTEVESSGLRAHYPAIIQLADGRIHVTYTFQAPQNEGSLKTIRHASFDETWIKTTKKP